ncbi:MAG: hypothetical protein JSR33_09660, partial [Proteobacteria bacterium]|nr:hypothetical protein [Pseudomonadota bacterium]
MKNDIEETKNNQEIINESNSTRNDLGIVAQALDLVSNTISKFNEEANKRIITEKQEKKATRNHAWMITIFSSIISIFSLTFTVYQFNENFTQERKFHADQQLQIRINEQIQSLDLQIRDKIARK